MFCYMQQLPDIWDITITRDIVVVPVNVRHIEVTHDGKVSVAVCMFRVNVI